MTSALLIGGCGQSTEPPKDSPKKPAEVAPPATSAPTTPESTPGGAPSTSTPSGTPGTGTDNRYIGAKAVCTHAGHVGFVHEISLLPANWCGQRAIGPTTLSTVAWARFAG